MGVPTRRRRTQEASPPPPSTRVVSGDALGLRSRTRRSIATPWKVLREESAAVLSHDRQMSGRDSVTGHVLPALTPYHPAAGRPTGIAARIAADAALDPSRRQELHAAASA